MPENREEMKRKHQVCIVNVGHFRSGTTTLAAAAKELGLKAYRKFPDLTPQEMKQLLHDPVAAVEDWFAKPCDGASNIIGLAEKYDVICDGWVALLPLLSLDKLQNLKHKAKDRGIHLSLVASTRDIGTTVQSELQHWVINDLERRSGLDARERGLLEQDLAKRARTHRGRIDHLSQQGILKVLPLESKINEAWSKQLSNESQFSSKEWSDAIGRVGKQNANPTLPIEGILLTVRLGDNENGTRKKIDLVDALLDKIEEDSLCRYLVVFALDQDEAYGRHAIELQNLLEQRARGNNQMQSFHFITNPPQPEAAPFAICSAWNEMATTAWEHGADWVVLLGDDIEINCTFHYRAFYRSFLDIAKLLKVPFGFGCPWWNDQTFPGFPSFPCVGKKHLEIFGGLVPDRRRSNFVNQDLDPYLHVMYSKFFAAPSVTAARLTNKAGGNVSSNEARYQRIPTKGWQDFALEDSRRIREHLPKDTKEAILLDVVVPSYRVRLDYLQSICSLNVPKYMQTIFIIIIDNPTRLIEAASGIAGKSLADLTLNESERILEHKLSESGNTLRVRCNPENVGASASRNYGLDESAAEFVLNLDDDLTPNPDLLNQYGKKLLKLDENTVGLIGLVRFPRSPQLPLKHAAVLMSYLTFMFEIADKNLYDHPAWGVTANILFRRTKVRFDLSYAKTGGGEDVDFALKVAQASHGGKLLPVPEAYVIHPFWPGSIIALAMHFFNWAIGDSGLFHRFPQHVYWSFPNVSEMVVLLSPLPLVIGLLGYLTVIATLIAIDILVDASFPQDYNDRCQLLVASPQGVKTARNCRFCFCAYILAKLYIVVLEFGRLYGHMKRNCVLSGIFRRFDWHCGRLISARANFRKREACKFVLSVAALFFYLHNLFLGFWEQQCWMFGEHTCSTPWKNAPLQ